LDDPTDPFHTATRPEVGASSTIDGSATGLSREAVSMRTAASITDADSDCLASDLLASRSLTWKAIREDGSTPRTDRARTRREIRGEVVIS